MKWGEKYGPEYVNRLHRQVVRNLRRPHRFVCLTDRGEGLSPGIETLPIPDLGIPGPKGDTTWKKLGVFSPDLGDLRGPALFLDLDLLVLGPLDDFFDYQPEKICIIHNWISRWKMVLRARPEIGNSSVFRFPVNECGEIIDRFQTEKDQALRDWWPPQTYLTERIRHRMAYWPEEWVKSFKFHCRPPFPLNLVRMPKSPENFKGTRLLAFHGRPNPDQALAGYTGRKPHHSVRPTTWIENYWSDEAE